MKFIRFMTYETSKAAELAQVSDKVWANPPEIKSIAVYVCQGIPFAGVPQQNLVSIQVIEAESNEALAATAYPLALAGGTIWDVPILEMPHKGIVKTEKKYRR